MKWMTMLFIFFFNMIIGQVPVSLISTSVSQQSLKKINGPAGQWIPYQVNRGMMYTSARINGKTGSFIIDTGAPTLVINQDYNNGEGEEALSLASTLSVQNVTIENFKWGGMGERRIDGLATDISHLEKASGKTLTGLIGFEVLKDYELFLDPERQMTGLFSTKNNLLHRAAQPIIAVDLILHDHLPIVVVKFGDKQLRLGLDTGAALNLLDQSLLEQIPDSLIGQIHQEEIQFIDQSVKRVSSAILRQLQLEGASLEEMKFLFTDLNFIQDETGIKIDGLLGYPFFQQIKCSLNYEKKKLFIWEFLLPNL